MYANRQILACSMYNYTEKLLLGTYMGVAGPPEITRLVEESDGLFLLGEIVCDTNFAVSEHYRPEI